MDSPHPRSLCVPILKEGELDIISHNADQTRRLGAYIGRLLKAGDIVCVSGDMGAGKTVFCAGIGAGWGATLPLTSPTFNLVHEHTREKDSQQLYHLDCYRLRSTLDAESIGIDEILSGESAVLLEWPEHIESVLPDDRLWIEIRILEPSRRNFIFEATGTRYEEMLSQFRKFTFGV